MTKSGIYAYRRKKDGRIRYVGQSWDIERRHRTHIRDSSRDFKRKQAVDMSMAKRGVGHYDLVILLTIGNCTQGLLNSFERSYIHAHKTFVSHKMDGLNMTEGGSNGKLSDVAKAKISKANKGRKRTKEARAKLSKAKKGKALPRETIEKAAKANKGRKCTKEARGKISKANKGRKRTKEARKRMSEARKGLHAGDKNPNFGRTHSAEAKSKISEAAIKRGFGYHNLGKSFSDETRAKISKARMAPMCPKLLSFCSALTSKVTKKYVCDGLGINFSVLKNHLQKGCCISKDLFYSQSEINSMTNKGKIERGAAKRKKLSIDSRRKVIDKIISAIESLENNNGDITLPNIVRHTGLSRATISSYYSTRYMRFTSKCEDVLKRPNYLAWVNRRKCLDIRIDKMSKIMSAIDSLKNESFEITAKAITERIGMCYGTFSSYYSITHKRWTPYCDDILAEFEQVYSAHKGASGVSKEKQN